MPEVKNQDVQVALTSLPVALLLVQILLAVFSNNESAKNSSKRKKYNQSKKLDTGG
jgi:hypothetical protein